MNNKVIQDYRDLRSKLHNILQENLIQNISGDRIIADKGPFSQVMRELLFLENFFAYHKSHLFLNYQLHTRKAIHSSFESYYRDSYKDSDEVNAFEEKIADAFYKAIYPKNLTSQLSELNILTMKMNSIIQSIKSLTEELNNDHSLDLAIHNENVEQKYYFLKKIAGKLSNNMDETQKAIDKWQEFRRQINQPNIYNVAIQKTLGSKEKFVNRADVQSIFKYAGTFCYGEFAYNRVMSSMKNFPASTGLFDFFDDIDYKTKTKYQLSQFKTDELMYDLSQKYGSLYNSFDCYYTKLPKNVTEYSGVFSVQNEQLILNIKLNNEYKEKNLVINPYDIPKNIDFTQKTSEPIRVFVVHNQSFLQMPVTYFVGHSSKNKCQIIFEPTEGLSLSMDGKINEDRMIFNLSPQGRVLEVNFPPNEKKSYNGRPDVVFVKSKTDLVKEKLESVILFTHGRGL